jgi:hypothetical protein
MIDPWTVAVLVFLVALGGVSCSLLAWRFGYETGLHDEFMRAHKTKGKPWRADGK